MSKFSCENAIITYRTIKPGGIIRYGGADWHSPDMESLVGERVHVRDYFAGIAVCFIDRRKYSRATQGQRICDIDLKDAR